MTEKEQFLGVLEREFPTTIKVLKAFPAAKADIKPHAKSRTAKDLAWTFVTEQKASEQALDGAIEFGKMAPPPGTLTEVIVAYEKAYKALVERVKKTPEAELNKTVKFFTAPKQMGDVRKMDILWFMLMDSVHHRGQLSVYLRMADAKVPSIYGPSADEPWM
ncbi:MAG: DinB family protein [Gemmatimonadales bacterium]